MPRTLTDDTIVHEWRFEFYSPEQEEWLDFSYWTMTDDMQFAIIQLLMDEGNDVEHLSCVGDICTYAQFKLNQGENNLELIRDLEQYLEEEDEQQTEEE